MKKVKLKSLKKILLCFGLLGGISVNFASAANELKLSASPITKNIYSIISPYYGLPTPQNKGWNSNSYFVVTNDGVLVFDTGSSKPIGETIKRVIREVTDKPIRWVVNSHSHADHWLGNSAFASENISIIASHSAADLMKEDASFVLEAFSKMTEGATEGTTAIFPNSQLSSNKQIKLGGINIELIFTDNAHSPGDILLWLPEQKVIFGGDILNSDWMPIITLHANVPNLIKMLAFVEKLNPVHVLTGHGEPTSIKSVVRDRKLLNVLWDAVKDAQKNGETVEKVKRELKRDLANEFKPQYKDFDEKIEAQVEQMWKLLNNK